ncbi:hypothetical protein [Pseudonocardia asaccharolytica]|uniref:Uncharacterized protein n=1 Tax=Pseudonocardia asaccharolytica DSM 44247 = NBRC 16224 TaxID=1123024 RepID=A0A511CXN1_9PSEU|nr:hypothetical protein [Pseudonocardia asaccharolytica]GEL17309.1 hypothetical protein PA7_11460 [Pseudonocardia asaccharolytica DSM 44247 = NBRC 16224]
MACITFPQLSGRDRALLRAIAADRCTVSDDHGTSLTVDGLSFCDQFAGVRLVDAGLVAASGQAPLRPRLTPAGRTLLEAA